MIPVYVRRRCEEGGSSRKRPRYNPPKREDDQEDDQGEWEGDWEIYESDLESQSSPSSPPPQDPEEMAVQPQGQPFRTLQDISGSSTEGSAGASCLGVQCTPAFSYRAPHSTTLHTINPNPPLNLATAVRPSIQSMTQGALGTEAPASPFFPLDQAHGGEVTLPPTSPASHNPNLEFESNKSSKPPALMEGGLQASPSLDSIPSALGEAPASSTGVASSTQATKIPPQGRQVHEKQEFHSRI